MKLCWDNLERFTGYNITRGQWFIKKPSGSRAYYKEVAACKVCGEPFIAFVSPERPGKCCTRECANKAIIVDWTGQRFGPVTVTKFARLDSRGATWEYTCDCGRTGVKPNRILHMLKSYCSKGCDFYYKDITGKKYGKLTAIKMVGEDSHGRKIWKFKCDCGEYVDLLGSAAISGNTISCGCARLKYGINLHKAGLVWYDSYKDKFGNAEKVSFITLDDPSGFRHLMVHCTYCNRLFMPSILAVTCRLAGLNGKKPHEGRFYCGDGCRAACPIFRRSKWPAGYKKVTSREVQAELRQLVLERDGWVCQYGNCGKTIEDAELHCHHFEGINLNPIESADLDMCITFCKAHHKKVHAQKDCRYIDLTCKT